MAPAEEEYREVTLIWNKEDPAETASAERAFTRYIRKGWLAFKVTSDGRKKQIFSFDPSSEKIQLFPLAEGG